MARTEAHVDEIVSLDARELDSMPQGLEFQGFDYVVLALLGLVLPVALLVWGWL